MKEEISVIELLSRIKKTRKELDSFYNVFINPDIRSTSRAMVTLCNKNTGYTINGRKKEEVISEIKSIDRDIQETFKKLQKLLMIKEQINAQYLITVKSPFDNSDITLSIAQILMLKSDTMSKYNLGYLNKLEEDYNYGISSLTDYNKSVLCNDKIDKYVSAKMRSLNIALDESANYYSKFADEYRLANQLELEDPLDIGSTIKERKNRMVNFYESIDIKLLEFNASKRIWIDLDDDSDFWGFLV